MVEPPRPSAVPALPPYRGLWRGPWDRLMDCWYECREQMPEAARQLADSLVARQKALDNDWVAMPLALSLAEAQVGLQYHRRFEPASEIIAVDGDLWAEYKQGRVRAETPVQWLGYEPHIVPGWSLIACGIRAVPEAFSSFLGQLNEHGLFDNDDVARQYIEAYLACDDPRVEPYTESEESAGILPDLLRIGVPVLGAD